MSDLGDFVRTEKIYTPYGDFCVRGFLRREDFSVRGFSAYGFLHTGISAYGDLRREDFSVRGFLLTQISVRRTSPTQMKRVGGPNRGWRARWDWKDMRDSRAVAKTA